MAIGEGTMTPQSLHPLTHLVTGQVRRATDRAERLQERRHVDREDLVIAAGAAHP